MTKAKYVWCMLEDKVVAFVSAFERRAGKRGPKKVRCPECNRQLETRAFRTDDQDVRYSIPKHKKRVK